MKLHWKQIALGVLTEFDVAIVLIVLPLLAIFSVEWLTERTLLPEDDHFFETTPMLMLYLIFGILLLFVGAYVASARSDSRKSAIVHACLMAVISTSLGALFYLIEPNAEPLWYNALSYGLILPTAVCGGLWRWRKLQRQNRVLDSAQPPLPLP